MIFTAKHKKSVEDLIEYGELRTYKKIKAVSFKGFFTKERLTPEQAQSKPAEPIAAGHEWGHKWEYGWFFTETEIPEGFDGQRIVFKAPLGEGLIFVNGEIYGALDKEHKEVTLTRCARAGERYKIAFEAYAGHGPENLTVTVLPEERFEEFTEDNPQKVMKDGELGAFFDDVFMLIMDLKTLYSLHQKIDPNSLRYKTLSLGLRKACSIVDAESSEAEFIAQVSQAREVLKPLLECENGSTVPTVYAVGHSHLDMEWLWALNETRRKTARTLGNQLRLMGEYPEYKYIQSQPWIFETIKNEYPQLYPSVVEAVKDGRIIPEGGAWVEMDTNIPSGESLIRQFIFGKSFIKAEFGKNSKILWLPDVFGCSASLPQIMKGCGVDYIYNAKMSWSYGNNIPLPRGTFIWKGIDGTEVVLHSNSGYATSMKPEQNIDIWTNTGNTENVPDIMVAYGHGDGGGGATREHLEYAMRQRNLEGAPKVKMSGPLEFFRAVEEKYDINKVFEGELWYAEHKGSYTTQARTKLLNRRSETALHEAEFWTALLTNGKKDEINKLWKELLFNQFHDIIPGTAIAKVYERAERSYEDIISTAALLTEEALSTVSDGREDALTVFNSLPWERAVEVELPEGFNGLETCEGEKAATYISDGKVCAEVFVGACGCESFVLKKDGEPEIGNTDKELVLENEFLRAEFNGEGELISLCDRNGQEYVAQPSNKFKIYKNHPNHFDAWDIDIDYPQSEIGLTGKVTAKIVLKSKAKTVLRITKEILSSKLEQDVILRKNSRRLDFVTRLDWRETHKLLKVDFNTDIHTNELVSEIQFGHIKRANHRNFAQDIAQYEKFQHKWSALMETGRGFAVLNDCKYGVSADNGKISLTLLTSAMAPMLDADKGEHTFTYSVCVTDTSLENSPIIREAYSLNCPATVKRGFTAKKSFFDVSDKNVVLETVKSAEDGSGDVIVRLYEATNRSTKCLLKCNFDVKGAYITNMLEENIRPVNMTASEAELDLKAFEVVTIRLKRR